MEKATPGGTYFTRGQLLRHLDLSPRQIQYWDETNLLRPSLKTKRRRYYDFANLVEFRVVESLLKNGFSTQRIRKFLSTLKRMMPREENLLARLQIHTDGRTLIFREKGSYFDMNGQGLLTLDLERLYHQVRPAIDAFSSPLGTRERGGRTVRRRVLVQARRPLTAAS